MEVSEEHYINDGKKLAYVRYGGWSDTVILFFHGFWGAARYLPEDAGRECCVISFDRPGIGRSDLIGKYRMEELFDIITACLKSHGVRSVRVFGHSAGGYYAQSFAGYSDPSFVRSLTLLSSLPPMNSGPFDHLLSKSMKNRRFLTLYMKNPTLVYFLLTARALSRSSKEIARRYIEGMSDKEKAFFSDPDNLKMYENVIRASAGHKGLGAFYDAISMYRRRDVTLPSGLPVYVWNGSEDPVTTPEMGKFLSSYYSAREFHLIPKGTHHMYLVHWHEAVKEALEGDRSLRSDRAF